MNEINWTTEQIKGMSRNTGKPWQFQELPSVGITNARAKHVGYPSEQQPDGTCSPEFYFHEVSHPNQIKLSWLNEYEYGLTCIFIYTSMKPKALVKAIRRFRHNARKALGRTAYRDSAIRISFHYIHNENSVDVLEAYKNSWRKVLTTVTPIWAPKAGFDKGILP